MIEKITANDLPQLVEASLQALQASRDEIDALNVFPVPDGDTGTNMLLTMQAVSEEVNRCQEKTVNCYATAITEGSLMGARGNSGVILSQILRGICDIIRDKEEIEAADLVKALNSSVKVAYEAVMKPVEGTMLTVIKDMAKAARKAARRDGDILRILEETLQGGEVSLEKTPELLDVLKEAGVVDAGAKGLVVMVQGIIQALKGEKLVAAPAEEVALLSLEVEEPSLEYLYCTEFILKGRNIDVEQFKEEISPLGDSVLVVGTDGIYRTHIHTNEPGRILDRATSLGELSQIKINNMQEQAEARTQTLAAKKVAKPPTKKIGLVAVAVGKGVKRILRSLGVDEIVDGGQSMNPSTADIAEAVEKVSSDKVVILPNNKNVVLTAKQSIELSSKEAVVIPTRSIPEAFSALLAFDEDKALGENERKMSEALAGVKTGEITRATRNSSSPIGSIKKGDFIGISNSQIAAIDTSLLEVSLKLISSMIDEENEVVTILTGKGISGDEKKELVKKLSEKYPEVEVEVHEGSQPLYPLIVGVE